MSERLKRVLVPLAVVAAGFAVAFALIATGPTVVPLPKESLAPAVRVVTATPVPVQMTSTTFGTVRPRAESELVPEVSGRIVAMSPAMVSGGFFHEGDVLLQIDKLDYDVALEQAKAGLARAESESVNARRAYERQLDLATKQSTSAAQKDDALNQLRIAEAGLREARARLSRAERDLERTAVVAPYVGRVRVEHVDVGQFVNRGSSMATIYATDIAEVRLPVHDDELAFLDLPLTGDLPGNLKVPVTLAANFAGERHTWSGEIVRSEGEIDPKTRMVHLVARVVDPYASTNNRPPLAVGLFVEATIQGRELDQVTILPRIALRGAGEQVFVVDDASRLRFRDVEVFRIVDEQVYVRNGLSAGERVCVSPLTNALDGMPVRVVSQTVEGS